ncbi:MAG: hypothetical protein WCZ00_03075 [Acholeplasmataceae bacterium]
MNTKTARYGVEYASIILNISNIEVYFKQQSFFPNKNVNVMFIPDGYFIVFSMDWLKSAHELEVLKCAFHETRHAYQKACIDFPEIMEHDEIEVGIWKKEFEEYKNPNFDGYMNQHLEEDAINFSRALPDLIVVTTKEGGK